MPGKDDESFFYLILYHLDAILEFIELDPVAEEEGELPAIGWIEFHLQELVRMVAQVDEALTTAHHCPVLYAHHQNSKGRRPACHRQVFTV